MSRETAEGSITGKRKLLIIHEAMGGCGRNVIDIVNGVDSSKFEVTVVYGTSRIDDYYRKWIPTMNEHATLIPALPDEIPESSCHAACNQKTTVHHQTGGTGYRALP